MVWACAGETRTSFGMDSIKEQEHFSFCLSEEEGSGSNEVVLGVSLVRKQQSVK